MLLRWAALRLQAATGLQVDPDLADEHIDWDQASVLVQLGRLEEGALAVVGRRSAESSATGRFPSTSSSSPPG